MVFLMSKRCRIPLPEALIAVHIFKSSDAQYCPQRNRRVKRFSRGSIVPLGSPVWRSDCMLATCTSATAPATTSYKCRSGTRCRRPVNTAAAAMAAAAVGAAVAAEDGAAEAEEEVAVAQVSGRRGGQIDSLTHTHTHMHMHTYTHESGYAHTHTHPCAYVHPHIHTHTHIHPHTRTHTRTHGHTDREKYIHNVHYPTPTI